MKKSLSSAKQPNYLASLRERAEVKLRTQIERLQLQKLSSEEIQNLVHELGTHQIELEMQNEELRRSQEELETSRSRYADLYDFAPVGYFTLDTHGQIWDVNLAGAQLLGIERSFIINKPFVGFIAEAGDRDIFSKHRKDVFTTETNQSCEIRLRKKDGAVFYARLQSVAAKNVDNKAGYTRIAIFDITGRKKIEEALKESERRFTLTFEKAALANALSRFPDDVLTDVNEAWVNIFGYAKNDAIGKTPEELTMGPNPETRAKIIAALRERGSARNVELLLNVKSGEARVFSANLDVVEIAGQKYVLSSYEDVSDRKKAEYALQMAYGELEKRVRERTEELVRANERLSQEVVERKEAEDSLRVSYAEIKNLKDRFRAENIYLKQEIDQEYNFSSIIGESDALQYVFFRVEQVAPQDTTVLLLGETGTGKGVVARAIHSKSSPARRAGPMITVNCSALPANLIESELFGREKGAFTGSSERQIGRFELADNGTLFLDEIGDMPMELQTKLLRVIQDGEFERLGAPKTIKVNVRIIASTNRNLDEAIRNNTFREDLFYRLNVFPITIPPLRQRKEDIPLLVDYFVAKFNKKMGKKIETVSKDTLNVLQDYDWPGNVRELESIIERAVITSQGSSLQVLERFEPGRKPRGQETQGAKGLVEIERDHILQVLQNTNWRIEGEKGAAAILGLNPSTLRGRMRRDGIHRS